MAGKVEHFINFKQVQHAGINALDGPRSVAEWSSPNQKIRARILPGCKVVGLFKAMLFKNKPDLIFWCEIVKKTE